MENVGTALGSKTLHILLHYSPESCRAVILLRKLDNDFLSFGRPITVRFSFKCFKETYFLHRLGVPLRVLHILVTLPKHGQYSVLRPASMTFLALRDTRVMLWSMASFYTVL